MKDARGVGGQEWGQLGTDRSESTGLVSLGPKSRENGADIDLIVEERRQASYPTGPGGRGASGALGERDHASFHKGWLISLCVPGFVMNN